MKKQKINVVFVTTHFNVTPNGPAVYANYLWRGFRNDPDIKFHIVAMGEPVDDFNLHLIRPPRNSYQIYRQLNKKALEIVKKLPSPKILHVNNSHMGKVLLNSPSIVIGQINDYQNADAIKMFFENWKRAGIRRAIALVRRHFIEHAMIKRQELTICNSNYTRNKVINSYRVLDPKRIIVVYKAVDVDFFRRRYFELKNSISDKAERKSFKLIFVGTNFIQKGLDILLESLNYLDYKVTLYIVGAKRNEVERKFGIQLLKKVENKGHLLTFLGNISRTELREILWKSDLFVLPSRSEAFGVATLEAVASGVPVLTSIRGGLKEIHESLNTPGSWRLPHLDNRCLSGKITEIVNNIKHHRAIAITISNKKLYNLFGVNRMVQEIKNIYLALALK